MRCAWAACSGVGGGPMAASTNVAARSDKAAGQLEGVAPDAAPTSAVISTRRGVETHADTFAISGSSSDPACAASLAMSQRCRLRRPTDTGVSARQPVRCSNLKVSET